MQNIVYASLGKQTQINVAAPAVATAISHTNTDIGRFWITAITFKLVTDANAATRYCNLRITANGVLFHTVGHLKIGQTASKICYWCYSPSYAALINTEMDYSTMPLTPLLILPHDWSLGVECVNMQAADQFDEIIIWALHWLDPTV